MQLPSGQSNLFKILLLVVFISACTCQAPPEFANLTAYMTNSSVNASELMNIFSNLTSNFTTGNLSEIVSGLGNYSGSPTTANLTELAFILSTIGGVFNGTIAEFQGIMVNITMGNATAPPPPPGNGTLNGTNGTLNGTNGTGNATAPSNATLNGTNGTGNATAPPSNATLNGTNGTGNATAPPSNATTNGTNGTGNTTAPPGGNLTNSTNSTPTTSPPALIAPPPINSTSAGSFAAPAGTTTYTSKRLQILQITITAATASANASTLFKVSFFNSSASGNFNTYNVSLNGTWTYQSGTSDTLSCSLIKQTGSGNYSLLRFRSDTGALDNLAVNPLASATAFLTANQVSVKENCGAAYFDRDLVLLNTTNATRVTLPTGWAPSYAADSIAFGVANNILYKYDPINANYSQAYAFTTTAQSYSVQSQPGKVIVAASTKTSNSTNVTVPVNVRQTFYIFSDTTAGFKLLNQFDVDAILPAPGNATITPAPSGTNIDALKITVPFFLSPLFTKLLVIYKPLNGTTRVTVIKSIDYTKGTVTNVTFKDQAKYDQTNALLSAQNTDFVIGQNHFIVRNQSVYNAATPTVIAVEEAYQFLGAQLVYLRNRNLTTTDDLTKFVKVFIDPAFTTQLVVVNVYLNAGTYSVSSTAFGSLASLNKVLPPTVPAYISFYKPTTSVTPIVIPGALGWAYNNYDGSNATTSTYYRFTPNATNSNNVSNVQIATSTVVGSWSIIAINENCHVEKKATPAPVAYNLVSRLPLSATNSTLNVVAIDITSLLTNMSVDAATWYFSPKCDRFAVLGKIFFKNVNNTFRLFQDLAFDSVDSDISAALVGNIAYALEPTTNLIFIPVYTYNGTIGTPNKLYRQGTKVLITSVSTNTAKVLAFSFSLTSAAVNKILDYSLTFTTVPKIQVSSELTKILVTGTYSAAAKADGFFIDYTNAVYNNITYPITNIRDVVNCNFVLTEKFLYLRGSSWDATTPPADTVFFLDKEINPLNAFNVNLTAADQVTSYVKTVYFNDPNGSHYFLVETVGGNATNPQIVVKVIQVSPQQALLNAANGNSAASTPGAAATGVTGVVTSTGAIKLCPPGCSDCSTGLCTGCGNGWSFDSSANACNKCGPNCIACNSPNFLSCTSCVNGAFLDTDSTCQPCTPPCVTCSTSATTCLSCPPGLTLSSNACTSCPRNCLVCTGATCTTCKKGMVAVSGACRGCSASCSTCNPSNITECTSCANGLYLNSGKCSSCPARCLQCTSASVCSSCVTGYTPNSAGTCVKSCQVPCATCAENNPTYCLSCYSSGILSNGACTFNDTCNSDSSCSDCGQGFGLIYVAGSCLACTSVDNCLQCSSSDVDNCTLCKTGYYVNQEYHCTACPASCTTCISDSVCSGCADGFTLAQSVTQGSCLACTAPCATCLGSQTYCLTCVAGYVKKTSKCQPNVYVGFKLTLGNAATTPANILAAIDTLVAAFLTALGENSTMTDLVTFDTITSGSAVVTGSVSGQTQSNTAATTALATAASSGSTFGGFTVAASSVAVTTDGGSSEDKTPLIVGLAVGIPIAVIVIILVAVVIYKKRKAEHHQVNASEQLEVKVVMKEQPDEVNNSLNSLGEKKNSKGKLGLGVSDN